MSPNTSKLFDDVFTMKLPGSDLVFTRYLYIKDEVRVSLLVSLLNKSRSALFWAYELYYSGFKHELFMLLFKIYYDFYATLNPLYEKHMVKVFDKFNDIETDDDTKVCIIGSIIEDFVLKSFNNDMFNIRTICESFEIDIYYHASTSSITNKVELNENIKLWIERNDARSFAQWTFNVNKGQFKPKEIYDVFRTNNKDIFDKIVDSMEGIININVLLVCRFMTLLSDRHSLKRSPNLSIIVDLDDVKVYDTIDDIKGNNVLKKACIYNIDEFQHLSLFKLTRNKYDVINLYRHNWEYHASFSPLWNNRLKQFGGRVDFIKTKVIFKEEPDDDLMQEFYLRHGLEPDEQTLDVQNKSIQPIVKKYDWKWFNSTYKKNGIFEIYEEELEELDVDCVTY